MKKSFRKLIPAILMVLLSASLMGTSTFAWFSLNNKVTVSGMEVRTKVTSNLLVSPDNDDAHFSDKLAQAKNALLEPVSTTTGTSFFYTATNNVVANGDAKADTYTAYDPSSTGAFNSNYGTTGAVGYVDYTLFLKATSTADNSKIALTKCNFLYNGAAVGEKAWRVAVFVNAGTAVNTGVATKPSASIGTLKTILALNSAANFTSGEAVTSTTALGSVTYGTAAVIEADIDAGYNNYYYVTIRLWLEGEDTTCTTDTFAQLTANYTLDLDFQIGTSVTGVTEIGSDNTAGNPYTYATVDSTAAGVTLTGGKLTVGGAATDKTPATYTWYNVADNTVVDGASTNAAPATAGDYYCIITDTLGNTYKTGTVTVS